MYCCNLKLQDGKLLLKLYVFFRSFIATFVIYICKILVTFAPKINFTYLIS